MMDSFCPLPFLTSDHDLTTELDDLVSDNTYLMSLRSDEGLQDLFNSEVWQDSSDGAMDALP